MDDVYKVDEKELREVMVSKENVIQAKEQCKEVRRLPIKMIGCSFMHFRWDRG